MDVSQKAYFKSLESLGKGSEIALDEVLDRLAFNENGLLPAIAQDAHSGEVLMLAWMNRTALRETLSTGTMTYWSRSRQALWVKGATSGHYQHVKAVSFDCDGDAVLCQVEQVGGACHTGRSNCFYLQVDEAAQCVRINFPDADTMDPEVPGNK